METTHPIHIKKPLAGPALKALLGFFAGIIACRYCELNPFVLLTVLIAVIIVLLIKCRSDRAGDMSALLVMFFSGMLAYTIQIETGRPPEIPDNLANQTVKVEGIIDGNVRYYYNSTNFKLKCRRIYHSGGVYPVNGLLPCTLYRKNLILYEGSRVIVQGKIKKVLKPLEHKRTWLFRSTPSSEFPYRLSTGYNAPPPVIVKEGVSFFGRLRNYISSLIDLYPYGGHAGLLRAMLIGDKSGLSPETVKDFARSGIAHIFAVSGLHVGIMAVAIHFVLLCIPISRKTRVFITVFLLFIYAGVCGFRPPVVRNFIMVVLFMYGKLFERPKDTENTLFIALLAILAVDPQSLYGPSLQLSFAAVWAITTFYPPVNNIVRERLRNTGLLHFIIRKILSIIIVSTLAFTATAPFVAYHFGSLPLLSIIVNVAAIPLAVMTVYGGICSVFFSAFGALAEPLAASVSFMTGIVLHSLSALAEFMSALPFASIETGRLSAFAGLCLFTWLYVLSRAGGRNGFKKALLYIPLLFSVLFTWSPFVTYGGYGSGSGSVLFFDVDQGDSALIEYGNNRYFLVDTGLQSASKSVIVPSLKNIGIETLDGIFLSHMDYDHVGGIDYIMENIGVDRIFCRESIKDSLGSIYGDRVTGIAAGDSIIFKEGSVLVLSPLSDMSVFQGYGITGENNNSLLLRFDVQDCRVLFTGDIEEEAQRLMVSWGPAINSSVLKVPHHGAETLEPDFVDKVNPKIAVISCGLNNMYGHPANSTIETLESYNITVLRTDRDGTIEVQIPALEVILSD